MKTILQRLMGLKSFKEEGLSTLGIGTIRVNAKMGLILLELKALATISKVF